jgi:Protein of unknown function (DUF4232)
MASGGGTPTGPNTANVPGEPPAPDNRGRNAVIVLACVLAAILIAIIIWLVATRAPAPAPTATPVNSTSPSASPRPTGTSTAVPVVTRCTLAELNVTLGQPSGAAGSTIYPIVFTNTGTTTCELHGYPGVSLVGDGNGTQLGPAADQDTSVAIQPNTLAPGQAVQAMLKLAQAANFAGCTVVPADGLRVYPPHSTGAAFVKATGMSACTNADIHLMTVQPVLPAQ